MVSMIKAAADIAHQSSLNAVFVRYPVKHKAQTVTAWMKACRQTDDTLLTSGLLVDQQITINYGMSACHGNDSRSGATQARLCTSTAVGAESGWLECNAISNHFRIDAVPIVAHKDMRLVPHKDPNQAVVELTAAERASQIGVLGCESIIKSLILGRPQCAERNNKRKIVICDFFPEQLDWMEASWNLHEQWQSGHDIPAIAYCSFYKHTDSSKKDAAQSAIQGMLLRKWWETQPDAGPPEPRQTVDSVKKPELTVLTWDTTGKPVVPDLVYKRFEDTDFEASWASFCDSLMQKFSVMRGLTQVSQGAGSGTAVVLAGPETNDTYAGEPYDIDRHLILEEVPMSSIDMTKVSLV
jgi:hypothetical protein